MLKLKLDKHELNEKNYEWMNYVQLKLREFVNLITDTAGITNPQESNKILYEILEEKTLNRRRNRKKELLHL